MVFRLVTFIVGLISNKPKKLFLWFIALPILIFFPTNLFNESIFIPPAYEVCHGGIMFSSFLSLCVCVCVCVCLLTIFVSAP